MSTLKELVDKHGLPLKVARNFWSHDSWFEVRYEYEGRYFGHNYKGEAASYLALDIDFSLHLEPKKTVRKYLFAFKDRNGIWNASPFFYRDEDEFKKYLAPTPDLRKIDSIYIDVDEE